MNFNSHTDYDRSVEDLYRSYPRIFRSKPYISVGVGWHGLLHEMGSKLEPVISSSIQEGLIKEEEAPFIWDMKEKYGVLVVSFTNVPSIIADAVFSAEMEAENKSAFICEECSMPGTQSKSGWIKTLCEDHMKTRV